MHVCLHCVWIVITQSVETFINNSKQEFSSKLNSLESFSFNTEFIIHLNGKIFSHIQQDKKPAARAASSEEDMHQQRSCCQANATTGTILLPTAREREVLIVSANDPMASCKSWVCRRKKGDGSNSSSN